MLNGEAAGLAAAVVAEASLERRAKRSTDLVAMALTDQLGFG